MSRHLLALGLSGAGLIAFAAALGAANRPLERNRAVDRLEVQAKPGGEFNQAQPAAPPALDVFGGVASTHVIVRTAPQVEPWFLDDGRWTFIRQPEVNRTGVEQVQQSTLDAVELEFAATLEANGITSVRPAFANPAQNEMLAEQFGLNRYYVLNVPRGTNTPALVQSLRSAIPAGYFETIELDGVGGVAGTVPNDPQFANQYGLFNDGQALGQANALGNGCGTILVGTPGADIGIVDAWDISTGSDDLVIAVLDSGLHPHVDLAGRTLPGHNVFSCCFGGNSCESTYPNQQACQIAGGTWVGYDNTVDGCSSHGTHVSGIIAANPDNDLGMAGITWQGRVVPVVVVNGCFGLEIDVAAGLIWAADQGVDVINMSLQYYTGSAALHSAVQYARASGAVLIAASGNFQSVVAFPARWPETITVGATNNRDLNWVPSNSGPEVDVSAPGECVRSLNFSTLYTDKSGTSFAAPHVSGTVALMLALDPSLTHDDIQDILEQTADDLGPPGWDAVFGEGRINAHAALLEVQAGISIVGDLNGDQVVGVADLLLILAAWGDCAECGPEVCPADLTNDCSVGVADLLILLSNWG